MLAGFLFTSEDVFKKVGVLSGGEKARLTFAKLMLEKSDLLILDEPTNHLDAPSREVLEGALSGYDGTLLCVSHDRYFISKLANRIFEMRTDGVFDFKGGYETYISYRDSHKTGQESAKDKNLAVSDAKSDYVRNKEDRNRRKNAEKKLEQTEKDIAALEEELKTNAALQLECSGNYQRASELYKQEQQAKSRLEELYEKWEQLQSELGN